MPERVADLVVHSRRGVELFHHAHHPRQLGHSGIVGIQLLAQSPHHTSTGTV
jgi:hypothetical protein